MVDLRARYELEADEVDRYTSDSYWDRRYHEQRFEAVSGAIRPLLARTSSFLDVGCGSGEYLALASSAGVGRVVGIDLAESYARRARRAAPAADLCAGDAGSLPFPDRSIDVVLCSEVIEHLEPSDGPKACRELFRVARVAVVVSTPNAAALIRRLGRALAPRRVDDLDRAVGHINLLDATAIDRLLRSPGWRLDGIQTIHVLPPVLGEGTRLPHRAEPLVGSLERAANHLLPRGGNTLLAVAVRAS